MKVELCSFSGYKIYPGHGGCYVRTNGKVFQFLNAKCESVFLSKRNPCEINWTVLYRRKAKQAMKKTVPSTTKATTKATAKQNIAKTVKVSVPHIGGKF